MTFSSLGARRPNSAHRLTMESAVVPGLADSVARPGSGQFVSEQHATTASLHLPRVAPVHAAVLRAGSVILKNETG
jgi:hypothetical protein